MRACLIGAGGNIGGLKDHESTDIGPPYLTHAHAIRDSDFQLSYLVDDDIATAVEASGKWSDSYLQYSTQPKDGFELYTIATPPETHYELAMQVLEFRPRAVVIEKPCGSNLEECVKIVEAYSRVNIPLVVNYQRRFSELLSQIAKMPISKVKISYRGDFNYAGCHAWDLKNMLSSFGLDTILWSDHDIKDAMEIKVYREVIKPNLDYAFLDLYVNLYDHLTKDTPLLSPGVNAIYPHLMNNETSDSPIIVFDPKDGLPLSERH